VTLISDPVSSSVGLVPQGKLGSLSDFVQCIIYICLFHSMCREPIIFYMYTISVYVYSISTISVHGNLPYGNPILTAGLLPAAARRAASSAGFPIRNGSAFIFFGFSTSNCEKTQEGNSGSLRVITIVTTWF
jgi:hypothetical protein